MSGHTPWSQIKRKSPPRPPQLFDRMMAAWGTYTDAEEALCEEMLRLLGADPDDLDAWPFEDTGWDWHDLSVELYGVKPGLLLTPEQLDRFWVTGFHVLYLNYADETQRAYSKARGYEPSELRQGTRKVPSLSERKLRQTLEHMRTVLVDLLSTKHETDEDDLGRSCLPHCWVCRVIASVTGVPR